MRVEGKETRSSESRTSLEGQGSLAGVHGFRASPGGWAVKDFERKGGEDGTKGPEGASFGWLGPGPLASSFSFTLKTTFAIQISTAFSGPDTCTTTAGPADADGRGRGRGSGGGGRARQKQL